MNVDFGMLSNYEVASGCKMCVLLSKVEDNIVQSNQGGSLSSAALSLRVVS